MQPLTEPPQIWEAVATDRALLADWAGRWPDSVWERPTPCAGWTVRQVLGHVTSMATASKARTLVTYLRSGANWDRASNMLAAAASEAGSNDDVIGRLRSNAASRHAPPGLRANGVLAELVAHITDLSVAVGEPVHIDAAHLVTTLVYLQRRTRRNTRCSMTRSGWVPVLDGARRSAGLVLMATDVDWHHDPNRPTDPRDPVQEVRGTVEGSAAAIIAALSGRRIGPGTVVGELAGDGVDQLLAGR